MRIYIGVQGCGVKLIRGGVVQRASEGGFSATARSNRFNPALRITRVDMRPSVTCCRPHLPGHGVGSGGHSPRHAVWSSLRPSSGSLHRASGLCVRVVGAERMMVRDRAALQCIEPRRLPLLIVIPFLGVCV